jgi:pyruvate dehydrogenase E2 component (dihydrolipoamide acetyltransferase)
MAKILDMPKLSPTMEEGVLSAWHKKEGDTIVVDDLLADVETDKATMEFRAFDKGTLLKLLVPAGATVKLGQPVAVLGAAGEDVSALVAEHAGGAAPAAAPTAAATQTAPSPQTATATPAPTPAASAIPPVETLPPPAVRRLPNAAALDRTAHLAEPGAPPVDDARVLASPYVRQKARDLGVDLHAVHGSGPNGRVLVIDLEGAKSESTAMARVIAPATLPAPAREASRFSPPDVRPLSMMRKTIARRLTEAKQTVPHFYLTIDVDAGELTRLRETINAELSHEKPSEASSAPAKVSLNDLLIRAVATALVRVPECNAQFSPEAILVHTRVDISVAVAVPDGLVTPVLRNADRMSVVAIAREVRELASRARAKKLKPEEMSDGTFSISNLGMFGIDAFSAVINPPEGAILAIGRVRDEPVVVDGAVVAGKRLALTLSCDHRVIDGAVGASFLAELRGLIEHPLRVLTG